MSPRKVAFSPDMFIFAIAGMALCASIAMLLIDPMTIEPSIAGDMKVIGTISTSQKDVRRRIEAGLTWNSVRSLDSIFNGDAIFTGDNSRATIDLEGGIEIELAPRSFLVVRDSDSKLWINLAYGNLTGKIARPTKGGSGSTIVINSRGSTREFEVAGSSATISLSHAKGTKVASLEVVDGAVSVVSSNGSTSLIRQAESIELIETDSETTIAKGPRTAAEPPTTPVPLRREVNHRPIGALSEAQPTGPARNELQAPLLSEPPSDTNVIALDEAASYVDFRWQPVPEAGGYMLQIAADPAFSSIVANLKVRGNAVVFEGHLPPGTVYWRVRAEKSTPGKKPAIETSQWSRPFSIRVLRSK